MSFVQDSNLDTFSQGIMNPTAMSHAKCKMHLCTNLRLLFCGPSCVCKCQPVVIQSVCGVPLRITRADCATTALGPFTHRATGGLSWTTKPWNHLLSLILVNKYRWVTLNPKEQNGLFLFKSTEFHNKHAESYWRDWYDFWNTSDKVHFDLNAFE